MLDNYQGKGNDGDDDVDDDDVDHYDIDHYDVDHYEVDHYEVDHYEVDNYEVGDFDVDDFGEDDDIDLVVSVLILNMLCNESHGVDRFLKMWLLTQLTLSKTTAIISFQRVVNFAFVGNFFFQMTPDFKTINVNDMSSILSLLIILSSKSFFLVCTPYLFLN